MIKPGTIFNMQMHGHFPMCAIIPYTEQSYYVLNLETGDIDFKGSLDEVNNEIQARRHKIIVTTEDIHKQAETENNRLYNFLDELYNTSELNTETKLKKQLQVEMHALEMIKTRTLDLINLLKNKDIKAQYAFDDLKNWIIKTEEKSQKAINFIEKEYQEIKYDD